MSIKRLFALALVLLTVFTVTGAMAVPTEIEELLNGDSLGISVSDIRLDKLNASSDDGFRLVSGLLSPLSLTAGLADGKVYIRLTDAEETVLDGYMDVAAQAEDTQPLFHETLGAIFSEDLPAVFQAALPEGEPPQPEKRSTSVRRLGRSTQRTEVTLDSEWFQSAPEVLTRLYGRIRLLTAHLPHSGEISAWLDGAAPVSALTLTRLEDAEGKPVAWQLNGRFRSGTDTRRLSLTGGISGTAAYITCSLPAVSGKNLLKFTCEVYEKSTKKEDRFTVELTYQRKFGKENYRIRDNVQLKAGKTADSRLTGTVTRKVTLNDTGTTWTVKPSLAFTGKTLAGTVDITKVWAQTTVYSATARLAIGPVDAQAGGQALTEADVAGAAARWYLGKYRALSPADQRMFVHMLRSDHWMNGPVEIAPPDAPAAQAVEEEGPEAPAEADAPDAAEDPDTGTD